MGNNNTKSGQGASGSVPASRTQDQRPRENVVYIRRTPQQDNGVQFAASRMNNQHAHPQPTVSHTSPSSVNNIHSQPQPYFSHISPHHQTSGSGIPSDKIYPSIPSHDPTLKRQVFAYNIQENNLKHNREPINKVLVSQEVAKPVMDISVLLELSSNESSYIVRHLKDKISVFENTVVGSLSNSVLVVLMKIVRKICVSDLYSEKIELLKTVCCDNFLNILGNYLSNLPTHQKDCAQEDLLFLEGNVLPFFETTLLLIPSLICPKLKLLLIKTNLAVNGLEQYQDLKVDDATKAKLKKLELTVKSHLDPGSPEVTNEQEGAHTVISQESNVEQKNSKSGPSHSIQAHAKHLNFLTQNVFPNIVKKFDVPAHRVQGMRKNIYFVDNNEGCVKDGEFLLALAKYLLKQKYKGSDFLLLTTNELNMRNIVELKEKYESLKDITVGVINELEEFNATIVLISFAASESDVKQSIYDERQLCKALLGAKNGIYMIGNLSTLENESPFWKKMKSLLQQYEAVSCELPLFCELHQVIIAVSQANDLKKLKNGACSKRCELKLKCGHHCKRYCHFDDKEHKYYKCVEPCSRKSKKCSMNHSCPKVCHEQCGVCTVTIEMNGVTRECHELFIPRNKNLNSTVTQFYCSTVPTTDIGKLGLLPCNHAALTHQISGRQLDLWSYELATLCQVPCSAVLDCGHKCTGTCGSCRQGRVHIPCRDQSKITLACGHRFVSTCSGHVKQCEQKCFYECPHGMCKEKCGVPCTPCKEMCTIGCEHSKCTKKCYELCDRRPCFAPCTKLLACGHQCIGFCGEPCPPGPEFCRVCSAHKMKKRDSSGSARFVFLSNCGHAVRSNDLDRKAFSKVHKLESLACPVCGYNITKTTRYLNYVKELHRNFVIIRHVHKQYNENLTPAFWKIAKEIRSLSLPKEIENHPKIEEIKRQFQVAQDTKFADQKSMILLMFLRNLLYPVIDGHTGMASPHHLDWFLYLLLERYDMGLCSHVLRDLYKEMIEYQKLKGTVYKGSMLELHKSIAFYTYLEKNTWLKCTKGHLATFNSLLTECGTCDGKTGN